MIVAAPGCREDMSHSAMFTNAAAAKSFMFAGKARVTLVSKRTGARYTYQVRNPNETAPHFVSLLTGPDNTASYSFLGTVFEKKVYRHGKRSQVSPEAPSAKAFAWAWSYLVRDELPPECEVYHEGRCGRCGRVLTVPESVTSGFGPECAGKMAA